VKSITVFEVEHIAFVVTRRLFSFNQPIPEFKTRYPNVLESCLAVPFQTFDKKELYPSFIKKLSIMFYLMNKNHPFQNGNKRIAVTTLLYTLSEEKKWIRINARKLYETALWVAESLPSAKDQVIQYIEKFVSDNLIPY